MDAILWIVLAIVLGVVEVSTLFLYSAFLAVGALVAASLGIGLTVP